MNRRDWLLAALVAANGEVVTPVQLQKIMFLMGKRAPGGVGSGFYKFRPDNYGPLSRDIYRDLEALEADGLVRIDRAEPGRSWPVYSATPAALKETEPLKAALGDSRWSYLTRLVSWARALSFGQLVRAIYRDYPDQRVNSIFVG